MSQFAGYSESKNILQVDTTLTAEQQLRGDFDKDFTNARDQEARAQKRLKALQDGKNPEDPDGTKYGPLSPDY